MMMAAAGPNQWEVLEQELADALRGCEPPRPCPRKSALGFPERPPHPAALGRAMSIDSAAAFHGCKLIQDILGGVGGGSRSSSCAEGFEDDASLWQMLGVADEEAPLATPLAGHTPHSPHRLVPHGLVAPSSCRHSEARLPSRGDVLGWQLPGRTCCKSSAASAACHAEVGGPSGEDPRSETARSSGGASVAAAATPAAAAAAALSVTQSSPGAARAWTAPQRLPRPTRPFSAGLVLDMPPSALGFERFRRTPPDLHEAVESAVAASALAKLELYTVTAPFHMLHSIQAEAAECAVCMDSFLHGELIRTLPCCHRFHACCVDPWLTSRWQCPLCKHEVAA